jgi:hypothetical protein
MRHAASLVCLLAALSGTPLRQAEAADDYARALAKLSEPAHLEVPDGRVGDDPDVGAFKPANDCPVSLDSEPGSWTLASLPIVCRLPSAAHDPRRRWERATGPPDPSSRDRAWLGVYLF